MLPPTDEDVAQLRGRSSEGTLGFLRLTGSAVDPCRLPA